MRLSRLDKVADRHAAAEPTIRVNRSEDRIHIEIRTDLGNLRVEKEKDYFGGDPNVRKPAIVHWTSGGDADAATTETYAQTLNLAISMAKQLDADPTVSLEGLE